MPPQTNNLCEPAQVSTDQLAESGTVGAMNAANQLIALPWRLLVWCMLAAGLIIAGLWAGVVAARSMSSDILLSGIAGVGVSLAMTLLGVLIMTPWKRRLAIDWMTMWLAGTVFRVLATPAAAFLLYSAASPRLASKPFGLAVAVTYLVVLLSEAAILAQHFRRCFPA
jgi:hypothetical protein